MTWLDRVAKAVSPDWYLRRVRTRIAVELTERHYEAASHGRRTQGWRRGASDPNLAAGGALAPLRDQARDLVRNNPYAEAALATIADHTIGWGVKASAEPEVWRRWAETTACDADGRHDFYGLQKLIMRTVVASGECLVRRRLRRPEDGLPLPFQLQILEPDYLDAAKDVEVLPNGGRIVHGVEFDALGHRVAYWLFRDHPGAASVRGTTSVRIPAESVLHIYRQDRPGQVRGVTWFAPVMLTFKDFDDLEDATLMKQKVAACLSVIMTDPDGSASLTPLGQSDPARPQIDQLAPGMLINAPPGYSAEVVQPPSVREYPDFAKTQQRKIATGLGISYEDLTGDYSQTNYSSARMARLRHLAHVEGWQWQIVVPQLCDPVWRWAVQMAAIGGARMPDETEWNTPPVPMTEPDKEGIAVMRNIRAGIMTPQQAVRERGYTWKKMLDELQQANADLDARGLVLDIDGRKMTQAGLAMNAQWLKGEAPDTAASGDDEEEAAARALLRVVRRAR